MRSYADRVSSFGLQVDFAGYMYGPPEHGATCFSGSLRSGGYFFGGMGSERGIGNNVQSTLRDELQRSNEESLNDLIKNTVRTMIVLEAFAGPLSVVVGKMPDTEDGELEIAMLNIGDQHVFVEDAAGLTTEIVGESETFTPVSDSGPRVTMRTYLVSVPLGDPIRLRIVKGDAAFVQAAQTLTPQFSEDTSAVSLIPGDRALASGLLDGMVTESGAEQGDAAVMDINVNMPLGGLVHAVS